MVSQVEKFFKLTLIEVAEQMGNAEPGSFIHTNASAEFIRRQTVAQEAATEYTKKNARYMLWSVVVLAVSSLLTLLVTIFKNG